MSESKSRSIRSFHRLLKKLKKEDLARVLKKRERIIRMVSQHLRLRQFKEDVSLYLTMISDYVKGRYTAIPLQSILAVAAALIYLLNPFDVIPDFLFSLGFLDDVTVLGYCFKFIKKDFEAYKAWREVEAGENLPVESK